MKASAARQRPPNAPPDLDPAPVRAPLRAGALAIGLSLDTEQVDRLLLFGALLMRWNAVHNLTAIRDGRGFVTHHLLDSLAIVPALRRLAAGTVLDVGSGGGLPGIPIAIAGPDIRVTLVDAVQKKCAFLTQAMLELGLRNVTVRHARVEDLRGEFDVITSRAFASLADFVECSRNLRAPSGCWLAMKGRPSTDELSALPAGLSVRVEQLDIPGLDAARHLVEIRSE